MPDVLVSGLGAGRWPAQDAVGCDFGRAGVVRGWTQMKFVAAGSLPGTSPAPWGPKQQGTAAQGRLVWATWNQGTNNHGLRHTSI